MIKRTLEISRQPSYISTKLDQLIIQPINESKEKAASIPCEDIGLVCVDEPRVSYTHGALAALMKSGASLVVCGSDHIPAGLMLPISSHSEVVLRLQLQINASKPLQKRLWKHIVVEKVKSQSRNLSGMASLQDRLISLAGTVKSGDLTNVEAQAAKIYWGGWRTLISDQEFRRNPAGKDPVNSMLNYGYAILRAAMARALVAAGLQPALGLHHKHRANAFCLADDLIEPLRPLVDRRVKDLYGQGHDQLAQKTKAYLLELLTERVVWGEDGEVGHLMVSMHRMVTSLIQCFTNKDMRLQIPVASNCD